MKARSLVYHLAFFFKSVVGQLEDIKSGFDEVHQLNDAEIVEVNDFQQEIEIEKEKSEKVLNSLKEIAVETQALGNMRDDVKEFRRNVEAQQVAEPVKVYRYKFLDLRE